MLIGYKGEKQRMTLILEVSWCLAGHLLEWQGESGEAWISRTVGAHMERGEWEYVEKKVEIIVFSFTHSRH